MPNLSTKDLRRSLEERTLIGVYTNVDEPELFTVGWIVGLSNDCYLLAAVDEVGRADGFYLGFIEDVFLTVVGGQYLEGTEEAMMEQRSILQSSPVAASVDEALRWAKDGHEFIDLRHRNQLTYGGFVTDFDDEAIELEAYSRTGLPEGRHILKREHIFRICFEGPDQRTPAQILALQLPK